MCRIIVVFLLTIILINPVSGQEAPIASTKYFEFYNNYWVNLHHFLYQKAKKSQLKKLKEDGSEFLIIGETERLKELNEQENKIVNDVISYYKKHIIEKDLNRELGKQRIWLQSLGPNEKIADTTFSKKYTDILNNFSKVYKKHFWQIHKEHNLAVLKNQLNTIKLIETAVITKMERLSKKAWPNDRKVRVDLTVYANYAGAYTSTRPTMNILISTIDPTSKTTLFIETVFHEGSHLLFRFGSPFREGIYDISEDLKVEFPKNLWHASLFYLCGRAVQDELGKRGMKHQLLLEAKRIFNKYNTLEFQDALENYYQGRESFENCIKRMVSNLK